MYIKKHLGDRLKEYKSSTNITASKKHRNNFIPSFIFENTVELP